MKNSKFYKLERARTTYHLKIERGDLVASPSTPQCKKGHESTKKWISEKKILFFIFNWDSLHARLNSHYKAWSYKKKKHKKIKAYRKSL